MKFPISDEALDDRINFRGSLIHVHSELIEPTKIDSAYAAGFFDGEGSVNIARSDRKDCIDPTYVLNVNAVQVDIQPLLFIQNRWGGSICRYKEKPPRKAFFSWQCPATVASDFLFDVLQNLVVKRERAMLGIKFQSLKGGQGKNRGNRERATIFEQFYAEMRAMNGYPPKPWVKPQ